MTHDNPALTVVALYAFRDLPDFATRQKPLQRLADEHGVTGTLLLAGEGINGTIAGTRTGVDAVLTHIQSWPGFEDLDWKESEADAPPFLRMKVRLKNEIVTMGVPDLDPSSQAGTYVEAKDWNDMITRDDVLVIDTRNDYEVAIGSFDGAVNPQTASFREFPEWSRRILIQDPPPKIAMFCTGGIRCEKASAFLKSQGVPEVYHLKGGILKYLEDVDPKDSVWNGECFVFDRRVSVQHGLAQGSYMLCAICRKPFRPGSDTTQSGGVATHPCPACKKQASPERKARAKARQQQIDLAERRGGAHLGPSQSKSKAP